MAATRYIVSGRVQGVGFRYFVCRRAEALGIRGEVWNRHDGRVELVAQHQEQDRLRLLELALATGPGEPDRVDTEPAEEREYSGFRIGPTR
jgi:acylphosphatase